MSSTKADGAVFESKVVPNAWLLAFFVCDFNVDIGPEIALSVPEIEHSKSDELAISFHSLPDRSNPEKQDRLFFHFHFRSSMLMTEHQRQKQADRDVYGYCLFRQVKSPDAKRGFQQRTLVLISEQYFPSLFLRLLAITDMSSQGWSVELLESAYQGITQWPAPGGNPFTAPFLGSTLMIRSSYDWTLSMPPKLSFDIDTSITKYEIEAGDYAGSWRHLVRHMSSLSDLYNLFEMVLLSHPLVIFAPNPQMCSEMSSALVCLIRPVHYQAELEPLVILQSLFMSRMERAPQAFYLVGVTNPFLLGLICSSHEKSGREQPYILRLAEEPAVPSAKRKSMTKAQLEIDVPGKSIMPRDFGPALEKDDAFLHLLKKKVDDPSASGDYFDFMIQRHFSELTASFIAPLARFVAVSTASGSAFSDDAFFDSLAKHGSRLRFSGRSTTQRQKQATKLYEAFFQTPNFFEWLESRTVPVVRPK